MIAVIDTETNYNNEVMSIGVIIAGSDYKPKDGRYYIIEPEASYPAMFSSVLYKFLDGYKSYRCRRDEAIAHIKKMFEYYNVEYIYAYNAYFDYSHLCELSDYIWVDIMKVVAYKQYNKFIDDTYECFKSGRLKKNYGVESIIKMVSGNKFYCEVHNAIFDARDELKILEMAEIDSSIYESVGIIGKKDY